MAPAGVEFTSTPSDRMDDIEALLSRVGAHWQREGACVAGPVPETALRAFEASRGVQLPADLRAYFEHLGGMRADDWDQEHISFWPLSRVRTVAEEFAHQDAPQGILFKMFKRRAPPPAETYFCFADYLIWSHAFAIQLSPVSTGTAPVVVVYGRDHLVPVAPSFAAFLERYLANDLAVLFPDPLPGREPG